MGNTGSTPEVQYGHCLENDVRVDWEKVDVSNTGSDAFPGRDGHCASCLQGKLYVFGGVVHPQQPNEEVTESNELLALDLASKEWSRIKATGDIPVSRSAATLSTVGKNLYLFGGLSREAGWFDTLHKFDPETSSWSLVECKGVPPSPRDKLASAVIGQKIYIFGGFGPQGMEEEEEELSDEDEDDEGAQFGWFNDLFIFDTANNTWSSPMQMNLGVPTSRAAHGMCSVDKYLVIFGGRDANARRSDLHIFDTETRKWLKDFVVQGRQPEPRSFHTMTSVGNRVVILGGRGIKEEHFEDFHILDTENRHWIQPATSGSVPAGRGCHTAVVVGDKLVVYGGSGQFSPETLQCTKYYNDVFTVNTGSIGSGKSWLPAEASTGAVNTTDVPDSSTAQAASNADEKTPTQTDEQTITSSSEKQENGDHSPEDLDESPTKRLRLDDDATNGEKP